MGTSWNRDCQWASKDSYSKRIMVGRRYGISGDALEGKFWEEGLPLYIQSQFKCLHGWSVHNLTWQLVPVRDYSNAESMLTATGFTPLRLYADNNLIIHLFRDHHGIFIINDVLRYVSEWSVVNGRNHNKCLF